MRPQSVYGDGAAPASGRHAVSDTRATLPVSVRTYIETLGPGTDSNVLDARRFARMVVDRQKAHVTDPRCFPRLTRVGSWVTHGGHYAGCGMLGSKEVGRYLDMRYVQACEE